ncbi:hypothetical protein DsansV1_C25g0188271 [Dioscorea sansibarensis]
MGNVQNPVKLITSVFKLIADSASIGIITNSHTQCLRFVSTCVRHIISFFRGNQYRDSSYQEADLKYILAYLKSSFTYGAKLLHSVLTSSTETSAPPEETFHLSNDLLDLIASLESYLGSRYASVLLSVTKPWLPVIILGLGFSKLLMGPNGGHLKLDGFNDRNFPEWLTILSKAELSVVSKAKQNNDQPDMEISIFKTLKETMLLLLKKGNAKIREAIGFIFLTALEFGVERGDFDLVLGLCHFTCMKLLDGEATSCKELNDRLVELASWIERKVDDPDVNEEGKQKLLSAKAIIRSIPIHKR